MDLDGGFQTGWASKTEMAAAYYGALTIFMLGLLIALVFVLSG
jgi:hypothetical protein